MNRYLRLTECTHLVASGDLGLSHYLDCHVYLIGSGDEYALVDAGAGIETLSILENVDAAIGDLTKLRYILLTHCHGDHAGGIHILKRLLSLKVVSSQFEHDMLERGSEYDIGLTQAKFSGSYPPDYVFTNAAGDIVVKHGDTLRLGKLTVTALVTPGHTKGSTCFLMTGGGPRSLFSGDTVFWGGLISLLNTPGSEISDYRQSVQSLSGLDIECLFPSHGLPALGHGQAHIDKMLRYFRGSGLPPMPPRVEKVKW